MVNAASGALTLSFPGHGSVGKICSETEFLTLIPTLGRVPPPSWPSVSALWASPEWCNKAGDG